MPSAKGSNNPRTAVRGVRSSWETLATYSRRVASSRSTSVISLNKPTTPLRVPSSLITGDTLIHSTLSPLMG